MHRLDHVSDRSRADGRHVARPEPPTHPLVEIQRAIGNHATARMVSRVLKTTHADLTPSAQAAAPLVGDDYTKLCNVLEAYHADPAADKRLACVHSMQVLAERWLANAENITPNDPRVAKVRALSAELPNELAELRRELGYLDRLYSQKFKWMSTRATKELGTAGAMARGESGDNPGQSPEALQIVKDAGLSAADIAAIRIYTTEDFKYINPAMADNVPWLQTGAEYGRPYATMGALKGEWNQMTPWMKKAYANAQNEGRRGGPKPEGMDPDEAFNEGAWRAVMSPEAWEGYGQEGVEHGMATLRALKKLKPFPSPTYRGEQLTQADADKRWSEGTTNTSPTFYSTSKSKAVATHFAHNPAEKHKPVKIVITFDQQSGRDISELSAAPPKGELDGFGPEGEQEVLLLPGATIEVMHVVQKGNEWEVTARELDPPVELEAEEAATVAARDAPPLTVRAVNLGDDEPVELEAEYAD